MEDALQLVRARCRRSGPFTDGVDATKAALVNAIVEGEALAAGSGGDVLDELQRVLHSITAGPPIPRTYSKTTG